MEKLVPKLKFPEFEEEWNRYSLKQLVTAFRLGGNYENSETVTSVPLIKMGNIGRGKIDVSKKYYIVDSGTYNQEDILQEGDILFNTRNTLDLVGKVSIWRSELPFALYNSNLMKISFSGQVEETHRFMNYYFNLTYVIEQLRSIATGTTSVAAIYNKDLNCLKINLPSIPEQTKIAEFLTAIDKRIELLTAKKEKLTLYKKGVMQKIFNQEIRFKPDESGEFPEWEEKRLGDVLIKYSEKSTSNNQFPVLTSARTGIHFQKDYFNGNDVASKDNTGYNVVPRGYFTYRHMSDDTSFKFNINTLCDKGIVSTLYPVFTTDGQDDYFIKAILNDGRDFENFAIMQKQGGSRTYMYFSKLEELLLFLPSLREQIKIAQFAQQLDSQIEVLTKQITLNQSYKKGLLQQMFV